MDKNLRIKEGDVCRVTVKVWRDDELPIISNLYEGKITDIIEDEENTFFVKIENVNRIIPVERVVETVVGKLY